jgi:hypothetical protein
LYTDKLKKLRKYGIPQPENNQFLLSTLESVDSSDLHFLQPRSFPNQAPKSGTKLPNWSESGLLKNTKKAETKTRPQKPKKAKEPGGTGRY